MFSPHRRHLPANGRTSAQQASLRTAFFRLKAHGIEQELQFDLSQTEISGSKEAVATLESAEGALHF
jgi:hypothetical protein